MDLSTYKVPELKEILRRLGLQTSGTKVNLIARIESADQAKLTEICKSMEQLQYQIEDDHDDDELTELRLLVSNLVTELKSLKASVAVNQPVTSTSLNNMVTTLTESTEQQNVLTQSSMTHTLQSCEQLVTIPVTSQTSQAMWSPQRQPCTQLSGIPGQQGQAYMTQSGMMIYPQPTIPLWSTSTQPSAANVAQSYMTYSNGPQVTSTVRNIQNSQDVGMQTPGPYYETMRQPTSQCYSVERIAAMIPAFNPADNNLTSTQFIDRIGQLKEYYEWGDAALISAVLTRLGGPARLWADAQGVFRNWTSFVVAFLNDFPHVSSQADAHIKLMNTKMRHGDKFIDYYYKMVAIGRRENLDDPSIVRYILNGINDSSLRQSLSAHRFKKCSDLLMALQGVTDVCQNQQSDRKQSFEWSREQKENLPVKKFNSPNNNVNKGIICFKCRERGHVAKNCTKIRKISSKISNSDENEAQINALNKKNQKELLKMVTVGTNALTDCEALIDSGSGKSLIKRSLAGKLKEKIEDCCEKLVGFAGGEVTCTQCIHTEIKIDDVIKKVEFLLIDDNLMCHDMLVGLDILAKATVIIQNGTCKVMAIKNTEVNLGSELSDDVIIKFDDLLEKYEGCFGEQLQELGRSKNFKMNISVASTKPVYKKPYNIPIPKRQVVEEIITNLLELGIVRPSTSLYASPIVLVRKQNGEERLCVDYRQLNAITEKQPWSMPTIDAVLGNLNGHTYFTTLDLMSGYYQIEMDEESKHLTAFVTHHGHFEFERMPFGLRNAPCTFQRMMHQLIQQMGDKIVSYVDEIIIGTKTAEENLQLLEAFLKIVQHEGLTLRISKCVFLKSSVNFLGHIVDKDGIKPGAEKTDAVLKFPVPTNSQEVRRFLGLTGFFRKFVAGYAHIAKPLTNLTKKDVMFIWSAECQNSFKTLVQKLTCSPTLDIYKINKQHQLHTDASSVGIAAILLQLNDAGNWNAVAYFSRCCNEAESRYHAYELEVLAVVEACDRFRLYLLGKKFTIVTDCQSIVTIKSTKPMVPRIARWLLRLQEFDCEIRHRAGETMRHVDAMSRAKSQVTNKMHVATIETKDWVALMQRSDEKLRTIIDALAGKIQYNQIKQLQSQYIMKQHRLFYKTTTSTLLLVVPKGMRWRIVKMFHDDIGHPALETVLKKILSSFWFPRMRNFTKSYIKSCIDCAYHKNSGRKACEMYNMEIPQIPFQVLHLDHLGPFVKSKRGFEYVLVCVDALTRYVLIYPTKTTNTKPVIEALKQLTSYFGLPQTLVTDRGSAFTSKMFAEYCSDSDIRHIKVAVRTPRSNGLAERMNQNILTYLKTTTIDPKSWDNEIRMLQWVQNTKQNATTKFAPLELIFDFPLRDISGNKLLAALHDDVSTNMNNRREEAAKHIVSAREKWKQRFDAKHKKPYKYEEGDLVLVESAMPSTGESRKLQPKYKGPYVITKVLRFDRYVIEDVVGNQRTRRKYSSVMASDKMKPWCALLPEIDEDVDDQDDENGEEC